MPRIVSAAGEATAWSPNSQPYQHGMTSAKQTQYEDTYPLPLGSLQASGKLCVGIMSDRRYDNYIFRTLEAAILKRTEPDWPLQIVVFAQKPDVSLVRNLQLGGQLRRSSKHSTAMLADSGYTVVDMPRDFAPESGPPQKYGQALKWMYQHGEQCSVFLMLEDDALASVAWDTALSSALQQLQAHDGLWLWLKLMMPDNYNGWEATVSDIALLTCVSLLFWLAASMAVFHFAKRPARHASCIGFLLGLAVLFAMLLPGRQNLPWPLNDLAWAGLRRSSEPCCIVAQAYNPATVGMISSCMLRMGVQNHTDMALQPCLTAFPQLSRHTYMLLPDVFQHVGVKSTKLCEGDDTCADLRVTGMYLEDELAATSSSALVRAAASVPGAHAGWTPAALRAAKDDVLQMARRWNRSLPATGPEIY